MHAAVAPVLGEAARRDTSVTTLEKVTTKSIAPAGAGRKDVGYVGKDRPRMRVRITDAKLLTSPAEAGWNSRNREAIYS